MRLRASGVETALGGFAPHGLTGKEPTGCEHTQPLQPKSDYGGEHSGRRVVGAYIPQKTAYPDSPRSQVPLGSDLIQYLH